MSAERPKKQHIRWLGTAVLAAGLGLNSPAYASQAESEIAPFATLLSQVEGRFVGARVGGEFMYALSDFWALGSNLAFTGGDLDGHGFAYGSALVKARLTIDALTWVPALTVGLAAAWAGEEPWLYTQASAEVAYRASRDHAWFGRITLEGFSIGATDVVGVAFGYRWIRSPAADLNF